MAHGLGRRVRPSEKEKPRYYESVFEGVFGNFRHLTITCLRRLAMAPLALAPPLPFSLACCHLLRPAFRTARTPLS